MTQKVDPIGRQLFGGGIGGEMRVHLVRRLCVFQDGLYLLLKRRHVLRNGVGGLDQLALGSVDAIMQPLGERLQLGDRFLSLRVFSKQDDLSLA